MIIDIDMQTFRKIRMDTEGRFFFIEHKDSWEIFAIMNNILFRNIVRKQGDKNDTLFFENELKNAVRVMNIQHVNEEPWRAAMDRVIGLLGDISRKVSK